MAINYKAKQDSGFSWKRLIDRFSQDHSVVRSALATVLVGWLVVLLLHSTCKFSLGYRSTLLLRKKLQICPPFTPPRRTSHALLAGRRSTHTQRLLMCLGSGLLGKP